jgi:hypothetical protein
MENVETLENAGKPILARVSRNAGMAELVDAPDSK